MRIFPELWQWVKLLLYYSIVKLVRPAMDPTDLLYVMLIFEIINICSDTLSGN